MTTADIARTVVGILGNIISGFLFLSPVPTFIRICKNGSVEQYSAVPYLATLVNCMVWTLYGLPFVHPNSLLVVTINGSGCVVEIIYVLLFLIYSHRTKRLKVFLFLLVELVFIALLTLFVLALLHTHKKRSAVVGTICIIFNIMMYASPLSVMKLVITTKSVEYMPFFLSLASFGNGVAWTTYALIRFDPFITVKHTLFVLSLGFACMFIIAPSRFCQIPNGLGTLFSMAQLILYATYYKSTKRQIAERKGQGDVNLSDVVVANGTVTASTK